MPVWVQVVLVSAALVAAVVTLWGKVLKPGAQLIVTTGEMLPLLQVLTEVFRDTPGAFKVLDAIAAEFRTNGGSSLREAVNRIEKASGENHQAIDVLKVTIEATKLLAEQRDKQIQRLMILVDRVDVKVEAGAATTAGIEQTVSNVAADLAAAHKRADDADSEIPGISADAAAQQSEKDKSV